MPTVQKLKDTGYALRTPCSNCPFRTDVAPYLRADRAREIAAVIRSGGEFSCHKTVTYDDDGNACSTGREQQCAGALIIQEREGQPNQMARISQRLGLYDPTRLDMSAPVYDSFTGWVRSYDPAPTVEVDGEVLEYEHCGVVGEDCEDPSGYGGAGGVYENDDPPTCHPVDDVCSYCGHPMCAACTGPVDPEDGWKRCIYCAEG